MNYRSAISSLFGGRLVFRLENKKATGRWPCGVSRLCLTGCSRSRLMLFIMLNAIRFWT
uniref:Uncharacterized protein n=1 Tax=Vibrio genomosp. F6 TaxID=723172 RepID=A0A0H3ZZZ0_9VIBR|nr:hypothetical protein [Vibrio genomosp. F6]